MVIRSHLTHPFILRTDWLECADVFTTHRKVESGHVRLSEADSGEEETASSWEAPPTPIIYST